MFYVRIEPKIYNNTKGKRAKVAPHKTALNEFSKKSNKINPLINSYGIL